MTASTILVDSKDQQIGPAGGIPYVALPKGATLIVDDRRYDVVSTSYALQGTDLSHKIVLREIKPSFVAHLSDENRHTVGTIMFVMSVVVILVGYLYLQANPQSGTAATGAFLRWGIPALIAIMGFVIGNAVDNAYLDKKPTLWGLYLYFAFSYGGLWVAFFWLIYFAPPKNLESMAEYANYVAYFRGVFDPVQPVLAAALGWLTLALGFLGLEGIGKIVGAVKLK